MDSKKNLQITNTGLFSIQFLLLSMITCLCFSKAHSQNNSYIYTGYSIETFKDNAPLERIINDFNAHYVTPTFDVTKSLKIPNILKGIAIGTKMNTGHLSGGIDLHFHRWTSVAKGNDSLGTYYFRKVYVTHNGFCGYLTFNIINARSFRAGPGFTFNIDQFYCKFKDNGGPYYKPTSPVDKFLLSSSLRFALSFGGPRFNFDIIPYYMIPFWKVNVQNMNEKLNNSYAKSYSKDEMTLSPANFGCLMNLCFGMQR